MNKVYDPYLNYLNTMRRIYPNSGNLNYYLKYLFAGIEFTNKRMLDIGGGSGLFTLFGGIKGLQKGVCLEPESSGSTTGVSKLFSDCSSALGLSNVELLPVKFLDYSSFEKFDIILLHNSVNHLDEEACINLLTDPIAKETYENIFQRLDDLASPNACLILADSSRYNLFPVLNVRNPFAPNIEWQKHQAPEVWAKMLSRHNFIKSDIRWHSYNTLRGIDRVFLVDGILAFLTFSSFCLRMHHASYNQ